MPTSDTVLRVTRNGFGAAEPELSQKLATTYFQLLDESDSLPGVIWFYPEGVKLVTSESPVLSSLRSLEEKGVHLVICNTYLKYYRLSDDVQVGIQGGMTDIIEAQQRAGKVITV